MSTIPFSYHLFNTYTNQHYYGIKYSKGTKPEDLWVTYFSSSKIVKKLIAEYGKDSFVYEIRRTFNSGKEALLWEHKVLRRLKVTKKENWINRHDGGTKFRGPESHSTDTKNRIGNKIKGMKRSQTTIEKQRIVAAKREQRKRESNFKLSDAGLKNIRSANNNPENKAKKYTVARNEKIAATKRGKKRKYLSDGSFIMVDPTIY